VLTLSVVKNDELLCSVGSDDVWTFSASVWADIWGPELSSLTVTGSRKSAEGVTPDFLVWQLGHELKPGDRIAFVFADGSASSPLDQTPLEEPSEEDGPTDYFSPIPEAELLKLESRAVANPSCRWQFSFPGRPALVVSPSTERQHCSLQLTWNDRRPDRLRVNLSKSSLREISARKGGEELLVDYVSLDTQFQLSVET
jgi:hypothetical protein